jgi:hypothetical protein
MGNVINYISAGNLGVYMIHEHPMMRKLIWEVIFPIDNISFYSEGDYLFRFILIILAIYTGCWVIEWIRSRGAMLIRKLFEH